eukprot:10201298-Ditylum_brightwellii.AAC.2
MHYDCDSIINMFTEATADKSFCPVLVSDGSGVDKRTSVGWAIRDYNNKERAECAGPAFSFKPSSFCAEAYGVLLGVRFLYHLMCFAQKHMDWTVESYADNN